MFHPIGSQPPSVYWRRRLLFGASLVLVVVLIVLTVNALTSGGNGTTSAGGTTPSRSAPSTPPATSTTATTAAGSSHASSRPGPAGSGTPARSSGGTSSTSSSATSSAARTSSPPPPPTCVVKDLQIAAVPQHASYHVGDRPVLQLRVTDTGAKPCVQDLADKQVVLLVYNGESRVWGSHDCKIEPGTDPRTLAPGVPVLVAVSWSGLSSQSPCTGTRQRVGAGTYTLYGSLAGRTGVAGRFTIS